MSPPGRKLCGANGRSVGSAKVIVEGASQDLAPCDWTHCHGSVWAMEAGWLRSFSRVVAGDPVRCKNNDDKRLASKLHWMKFLHNTGSLSPIFSLSTISVEHANCSANCSARAWPPGCEATAHTPVSSTIVGRKPN